MSTDIRDDDIYRLRLRAPHKKQLQKVLRDPAIGVDAPRPEPQRESDGHYGVVVFVTAVVRARLLAREELEVADNANLSRRMREVFSTAEFEALRAALAMPGGIDGRSGDRLAR